MGMIMTTSNGTRSEYGLDWIYDPAEVDGDETGLSWSGSAQSVIDVLREAGLWDDEIRPFEADIDTAEAAFKKARSEVDPDDDYLIPRLDKSLLVIANGRAIGATHLIAD